MTDTVPGHRDEVVERTGFLGWWDRLGRGQRTALVVVGVIVAVNIGLSALSGLVGSTPGGPVSSSFSTGDGGVKGWSELLQRQGHEVVRLRDHLADRDTGTNATVVLVDAYSLSSDDALALSRFVRDGGHLVAVGVGADDIVATLGGTSVEPERADGTVHPWLPVPEVDGVADVVGASDAWQVSGGVLPVAGGVDGDALVVVSDVGRGRVVGVADASVFQNQNLDRADNAALALAVVGGPKRPVVFVESVHGFDRSGLDAVPSSWRWAFGVLVLALGVGLWSAGTRFGTPEPDERELRPARQAHVDAVAADLGRVVSTPAEVVEPLVRAIAADHLDRLDRDDRELVTTPTGDLDHALAVGRLAAARRRAATGTVPRDRTPADPTNGGTRS